MRDFDPLFEVADVDSGSRLVGSKVRQGYVSECNDTYVALGGGPPVSADMVNICGYWGCCGEEVLKRRFSLP